MNKQDIFYIALRFLNKSERSTLKGIILSRLYKRDIPPSPRRRWTVAPLSDYAQVIGGDWIDFPPYKGQG
jgi:hypothetical protein